MSGLAPAAAQPLCSCSSIHPSAPSSGALRMVSSLLASPHFALPKPSRLLWCTTIRPLRVAERCSLSAIRYLWRCLRRCPRLLRLLRPAIEPTPLLRLWSRLRQAHDLRSPRRPHRRLPLRLQHHLRLRVGARSQQLKCNRAHQLCLRHL